MRHAVTSTSELPDTASSWRRKGETAGMVRNERSAALAGATPVIASHARRDANGPDAEIGAATQDSFSLLFMLADLPAHEFWSDDGHCNVPDLASGSMHIMDLRTGGTARLRSPFDSMNIAIPRSALEALAEQIGTAPPKDLRVPEPWQWRDPVVASLQVSLVRSIAAGREVDDLVFEHLLSALMTHVAIRYGDMRRPSPGMRGALAARQLRRAQEAMTESFEDPLALSEIARRCDLSPSHFSRAFKLATGKSPSEWRLERRIELAQKLLRNDEHSIAEVALLAGFADQSHFTKSFSRRIGRPPGDWLRLHRRP